MDTPARSILDFRDTPFSDSSNTENDEHRSLHQMYLGSKVSSPSRLVKSGSPLLCELRSKTRACSGLAQPCRASASDLRKRIPAFHLIGPSTSSSLGSRPSALHLPSQPDFSRCCGSAQVRLPRADVQLPPLKRSCWAHIFSMDYDTAMEGLEEAGPRVTVREVERSTPLLWTSSNTRC